MRGPEGLGLVGLEDDLTVLLAVAADPSHGHRRHPGHGGEPVDGSAQGALVADRRHRRERRGAQVPTASRDVMGPCSGRDGDGEHRHGVDGDHDARHRTEGRPGVLSDPVETDDLRRGVGHGPAASRHPPGQDRPGPHQTQHRAQEGGGQQVDGQIGVLMGHRRGADQPGRPQDDGRQRDEAGAVLGALTGPAQRGWGVRP